MPKRSPTNMPRARQVPSAFLVSTTNGFHTFLGIGTVPAVRDSSLARREDSIQYDVEARRRLTSETQYDGVTRASASNRTLPHLIFRIPVIARSRCT